MTHEHGLESFLHRQGVVAIYREWHQRDRFAESATMAMAPETLIQRHSGSQDIDFSISMSLRFLFDTHPGDFKILEIPGDASRSRRLWLQSYLGLPQYVRQFDILEALMDPQVAVGLLLVSADHPAEALSFLRRSRPIFPELTIVPVVTRCQDHEIEQLVQFGAKDVLHSEMEPREAQHRLFTTLKSIWPGSGASIQDRPAFASEEKLVVAPLSSSEEAILGLLLQQVGQIVPYTKIAGAISSPRTPGNRNSIKVIVSRLRRKLVDCLKIENCRGEGFRVVIV